MKNFKRILALVLTLMFIVGSCASLSAYSGTAKWYGKAVNWIESTGIDTIGSSADKEIDRNTFAMWIAKIESTFVDDKLWDDKADSTSFADVKPGDHYYAAIAYAEESGFIQGDGDGNFRPDSTISFAEACAIITRVMGYDEFFEAYYGADRTKYATYEEWYKANWQYNYIRVAELRCKAIDATWVANVGRYVPQHKLTKGQAAYLLYTLKTSGANVRHNGYDMGYKLGATLPDIKFTAVVKTLTREPLNDSQLKGYKQDSPYYEILNGHVRDSLGLKVMANYWAERNYDVASQVVTPYSKILDIDSTVELQLFDGENFTSTIKKISAKDFQKLVRVSLGKPANVDVANEEVFYLFDYVREGSVLNLTVSGNTVKALSIVDNHVVDTYRVVTGTTNLDYYLNGLANSYGQDNPRAVLPTSYNAEKDVTAWSNDGKKLTFQGTTYTLRAKGSNYTGISDEIKVYGYEKVGVSEVRDGVTYDKYYTIGTGEVVWVKRGETPAENLGKWLEKGNLVQLTTAEANAQLINAAQGEVEAVFSDLDGDGKYDVAVVTSYDSFFIADGCENIAGYGAEKYENGNANQYAKGVPSAGAVIINATATPSASRSTDAWTLDTAKTTNKVQLIFNVSDRRGTSGLVANQWYLGYRSTPTGGTGVIDVLSYASGYIQDVLAKAETEGDYNGYYKVSIPVAKVDAETGATTIEYTVAYLPSFGFVPTTQTISYSLAGANASITVNSKTWMSFITEFYKDNFGYVYKTNDKSQYVYTDATGIKDYTDARFFNAGEAFVYNGKVVTAAEKTAIMADVKFVKTSDVNDLYFSKTADTELVSGKTYYTWDSEAKVYTAVATPDVANIGTYFEKNVKTYYVLADAETNTYYEVAEANLDKAKLGTYYEKVVVSADAFTAITLKVLLNTAEHPVYGFTTDTDVITAAKYVDKNGNEVAYNYDIIVRTPDDEGIYKVADEASVLAMVSAWVNNKYINYVLDADSKIILAKSAAADNGRGFVVNVEKSAENNTYKVDLAVTGTYKASGQVYYSTYATLEELRTSVITNWPGVAALGGMTKAKFDIDPYTANIWINRGFDAFTTLGQDGLTLEERLKKTLKAKTLSAALGSIITGEDILELQGAVALKTYNVRASASTIWDIANAATYRAIYNGSLAHDLTVNAKVTALNFYYVTMTKETGPYSIMRLSDAQTDGSSSSGAKLQYIQMFSYSNPSHYFNQNHRGGSYYYSHVTKAQEASELAWPNAGIVVKLDSTKTAPFYIAKVSESSLFVEGKTYYTYDADAKTYKVVENPRVDDFSTYYERVLNKTIDVPKADLVAAKTLAKSAIDAFVAKYSYVVVTTETNGYNPEYVTTAYNNRTGKYTFDVEFGTVSHVTTTITYKPYPVKANDGKYVVVYDENGAIVKGDAVKAETMTKTSGTKTIAGTTKNWVYYSFNGVIYAELEPATNFNFIKDDGTVNYIGVATVGSSVSLDAKRYSSYEDAVNHEAGKVCIHTPADSMFNSIRAMDKNESGFIPGYYMVTLASDPDTELKIAGSTNITVMTPDNVAGNVVSTTTTFKSFVASGASLFATRVQIAVSADLKTITNITVIGRVSGDLPAEAKTGTIVFVGSDATTVLNADETGTSYIVKTDRPAYALDGSEFGPVYYEYDTTDKNFKPENLKFIVTPGSFYKVDKNGKILANLGSMFGISTVGKKGVLVGTTTYDYSYDLAKFENKLDKSFFGTATITGVTGGKILATVDGEKNVDITGWNVKFIYTDLDATKLFLAEDSTNVGVAAFNEIVSGTESKYNEAALAKKVYEAARDGGVLSAATVAKYKEAYDAAVVALEEAKEAALAKMNGQFWSASTVEASAIKRYLDSAKYTYGVANPTLTFTYLNVNDTYYVIVPSFSK